MTRAFSVCAVTVAVSILVTCCAANDLPPSPHGEPFDQLSRQLREMQLELDALKRRDHERNAWEASLMERLPELDEDSVIDEDEEDDNEFERVLTPLTSDCGNITFRPGVRIQSRYEYNDETDDNDFYIRRFRMKMGGSLYDMADYYMELRVDNTARTNAPPMPDAVVENAWLDFHLAKETHYLRVGLYDVPFSRNALTSDSKLLLMRRSLIYTALAGEGDADNTVGLLFHGRPLGGFFEYAAGIFDSQDFETNPLALATMNTNDLMPAGRIVLNLLDPAQPAKGYGDYQGSYLGQGRRLNIGADAAFLGNITDDNFVALGPDFDLFSWGVEVFFNSGPFVFQAEYDHTNQRVVGAFADRNGDGWYAQAGYIIYGDLECCPCGPMLELAARYEELDDRDNIFRVNDYVERTTLGLNLYLRGHNLKIQTDYVWREERDTPIENDGFQLQLQFDY